MVRGERIKKDCPSGSDGLPGVLCICVLNSWRYMSIAGVSAIGNALRVIGIKVVTEHFGENGSSEKSRKEHV